MLNKETPQEFAETYVSELLRNNSIEVQYSIKQAAIRAKLDIGYLKDKFPEMSDYYDQAIEHIEMTYQSSNL